MKGSAYTGGVRKANCSSGIFLFVLDPVPSLPAAEGLGFHAVAPTFVLTSMVAGIAALAGLSVALMETLPQSIGQMEPNVTEGNYFDPLPWGGRGEGRRGP